MTLVHWTPFQEIENLQREMNQLLTALNPETSRFDRTMFVPAAELRETPDAIHLRVEIPGMDATDLDVQVMAEAVSIKGDRKSQTATEEKGVLRSEFRYGSFRRVIPLPARVQNDKVEAEYKDGILSLNLPKVEAEKNKVVKVNIG
ncbi:Hsp20/alpha crystallin family protein [Oculatella sp. LEGE 06141]|uniref:Hsp20/alpha crystallin family protein n=1 Tax=Oculatella sp. LEGE 06141 TaxID=1828648 RepID=UPI001880EB22|nr:Hsp20/alpha crystallin family protein [Oculatella sp. LEGE 06141]MBE9181131.1 Hsp20/alpha crystallin family protein [Oculatella sp. LEGE 06141]